MISKLNCHPKAFKLLEATGCCKRMKYLISRDAFEFIENLNKLDYVYLAEFDGVSGVLIAQVKCPRLGFSAISSSKVH